jgi:hypothetical protein
MPRIPGDDDDDGRSDGLLSEVVENIVERDRRKLRKEIVRIFSFVWGVISWFVGLRVPPLLLHESY